MKKISKILASLLLLNYVIVFTFLAYFIFTVMIPAINNTGLSFKDLFNKNLDLETYNKLKENLSSSISITINKLFNNNTGSTPIDYSNMPKTVEYPDERYNENFKKGLKYVENMD